MTEPMRAITVRQPWAWAIVHGGKDVENRVRSLGPYRGPVAIHAGMQFDTAGWFDDVLNAAMLDAIASEAGLPVGHECRTVLHEGAIIGVVDLVQVHVHAWDDNCSTWGMPDHFHLVLENPRPIEPIPAKGRLGLWRLDPDLETAIHAALGGNQ